MLAYVLALVVGFGSFSLYMAAFFFPEVHRKYDFIWSGVGMFYALVLWVCAGRITGGVLLGQVASVALLAWFGWQTLSLRRAQTPVLLQTQIPQSASTLPEVIEAMVNQLRLSFQKSAERSPIAAKLDRGFDRATSFLVGLGQRLSAQPAARSPSSNADEKVNSSPTLMNVPSYPDPCSQPHRSVSGPSAAVDGAEHESSAPEIYAEWDDLDMEFHPELDTVEGSLTEGTLTSPSVTDSATNSVTGNLAATEGGDNTPLPRQDRSH